MISDERSKQAYERLEIPKIYHPFITGAHNEKIRAFTDGTGVKVNIPPLSVQKDEISIAGEKDGVLKVKEAVLKAIFYPSFQRVNCIEHFKQVFDLYRFLKK